MPQGTAFDPAPRFATADPHSIELCDVEFAWGGNGFRLRVPTLRVGTGDRLAIIGPSGSGKTTLLNLVAGLLTPTSGTVQALGFRLEELTHDERQELRLLRMGLVFQEFELLEHLDAFDNVLLPFRLSPDLVLDASVRARARELLGSAGMGDKLDRFPARLSQGERQRVAVARALITSPALVLCDEPTGNLDAENRDRVAEMLFGYAGESGAPLVVVTHDAELVGRFERVLDLGATT